MRCWLAGLGLASLAAPASAADWRMDFGGFFVMGAGFATDAGSFSLVRDGEVHIDARLTADNGVTFRAHLEIEGATKGDQIDENYAVIESRYGKFKIGGDDPVRGTYLNGVIYARGGWVGYYDSTNVTEIDAKAGASGGTDAPGVFYESPDFSGFRFGVSYQTDRERDGAPDGDEGDTNDSVFAAAEQFSLGAVYQGAQGGWGYGVSTGYLAAEGVRDVWHLGGYLERGGFRIAAVYEDDATEEFAVGARYRDGPMTIGGGYGYDAVGGDDDRIASAWLSYRLAPGLTATAGVEHHWDSSGVKAFGGTMYLFFSF